MLRFRYWQRKITHSETTGPAHLNFPPLTNPDMELRFETPPSSMNRGPGSATMKNQSNRPTVTFEQLSYSNMLTLNALVELLTEKGVITKPEILERVKKLQTETKVGA